MRRALVARFIVDSRVMTANRQSRPMRLVKVMVLGALCLAGGTCTAGPHQSYWGTPLARCFATTHWQQTTRYGKLSTFANPIHGTMNLTLVVLDQPVPDKPDFSSLILSAIFRAPASSPFASSQFDTLLTRYKAAGSPLPPLNSAAILLGFDQRAIQVRLSCRSPRSSHFYFNLYRLGCHPAQNRGLHLS